MVWLRVNKQVDTFITVAPTSKRKWFNTDLLSSVDFDERYQKADCWVGSEEITVTHPDSIAVLKELVLGEKK